MADDNLEAFEPWIAGLANRLTPSQTRSLARRIGQFLRRKNAARIRRNVEPDGSAMAPRKPKQQDPLPDWLQQRIRDNPSLRKKFGVGKRHRLRAMFPHLRLTSRMVVKATADEAELRFDSRAARVATTHHFGLRDRVSDRRGAITVRYPIRRLLGFGPDDMDEMTDTIIEHLDKR